MTVPKLMCFSQGPSKKRKLTATDEVKKQKKTPKAKGKEKAADRGFIPIPQRQDDDNDSELSEEDLELLEEFGQAAGFLTRLDEKGISRCAVLFPQSMHIF